MCWNWDQLILSTPGVWSIMNVELSKSQNFPPLVVPQHIIELWAERSADYPVYIYLEMHWFGPTLVASHRSYPTRWIPCESLFTNGVHSPSRLCQSTS